MWERTISQEWQNVTSHNLFTIKNNVSSFLDQWGSQQQDCIHVEPQLPPWV